MGRSQGQRTLSLILRAFPVAALLLIASCGVHEAVVSTGDQYATRAAVFAIEQYRSHASPRMGNIIQCRFQPTCSAYGLESVKKHGGYRGAWKAFTRIARCNPLTPMGTSDPP
jgi:uncharacterized protein